MFCSILTFMKQILHKHRNYTHKTTFYYSFRAEKRQKQHNLEVSYADFSTNAKHVHVLLNSSKKIMKKKHMDVMEVKSEYCSNYVSIQCFQLRLFCVLFLCIHVRVLQQQDQCKCIQYTSCL